MKEEYAQAEFFMIDIPIGLKARNSGERRSDLEALRILEAWKSRVLPEPCREAVYVEHYEKAC